jgi:hypothetical protein
MRVLDIALGLCLTGVLACTGTSRMALRNHSLSGEVTRYTAAHGSGKGLVLRIDIPDGWAGAVGFDSVVVHGHSLPCRLTDGGRTLEANWFVPDPGATASVTEGPAVKQSESLPSPGELLPAHVLASRKGRPVRIPIGTLTEKPVQ